ncbi:hypothetical protein AVEN_119144-1 [Araneus ventricosus]|uniref:Integrase zinc-binding domain-containing protein n=1 Tax=Araneus ventricosus TaxID=182803 RepID=A0A4Y2A479_ARAVE|nr:hypothetical protein AVEN_119144-1 [Araneus ventricosus]
MSYSPTRPSILERLIVDTYNSLMHAGVLTTLTQLRERFWISKGRKVVGQQGQKKALYEEGVAQAKVPHTRCEKCRERTSSCLRKILLPPLHIKSGLMKNFVKAMDCGGSGFQYLRMKFPKVSAAKIKKGIFVGPQIRQLMKDPVFESKLTKKEAAAYGHHLRR